MTADKKGRTTIYLNALLCCLGFMVFSFFVHYPFPVVLAALAGLAVPAFVFSRQVNTVNDLRDILCIKFPKGIGIHIFVGLQLGLIYALVYRSVSEQALFPGKFTLFALPAAIIGAIEELVFRGFLQSYGKKISIVFGILFASFSHTAYKCCLFLAPVNEARIDIVFLFTWTFIGGLLFGVLREISKSVMPAVAAHLLFDILVYGESLQPPWWVW